MIDVAMLLAGGLDFGISIDVAGRAEGDQVRPCVVAPVAVDVVNL